MTTSRTIRLLSLIWGVFAFFPLLQAAESPPVSTTAPTAPKAASEARVLRKIIISDTVPNIEKLMPSPSGTFVTVGETLPHLDFAELNKRLAAGENRPVEEKLLAAIAQVIENFFRQFDYPAATAIVPSQSIASGELRVLLFLGKIRNINIQSTRWFSESLLREKLKIEQGGVVRFSELDRAISWTNNNPFRRVQVKLDAVPNTGEADLTIAVTEALPLRLTAAYDNTGNEILGRNRYTAAVSYGNLWGRDHQVSYQYITTDIQRFFGAHGFDYRVPLPWRHYVSLSASYLRARPEFASGLFVQDGKTTTADLRYSIPVRSGDKSLDLFASLNFKQSNNNLAFGGTSVLANETDVFQFSTGASTVRRDKRGAWAFSGAVTLSPGGVNARNSNEAFNSTRFGAKSSYGYLTLSFQRFLNLGHGWDYLARGVMQASQGLLLQSEQLGIGGTSTVRGYNESIFTGDHGFVFVNEILSPAVKITLPRISKTRGPLETRFVGFFDSGKTSRYRTYAADPKQVALASLGLGFRTTLATNFSLTADYGWQLSTLPYTNPEHSRGHIKASLAF